MKLLVALLSLFASCILLAEPTYQVVPAKPADKVQLIERDQEIHLKIQSATGIGRISLTSTRKKEPWPKRIVLSITTTKGQPLPELEGFTIQGKHFRITGSRKTSGKMDLQPIPGTKPSPPPKPSAEVLVQRTQTALQILIPGDLLNKEPVLTIQWIDYYR